MSDHPRGRLAGWILLALAGLALAVALSVTASNLSTQPIGLSAEPLRAGDRLAPSSATRTQTTTAGKKPRKKPHKQSTATSPATTATQPVPTQTSSGGAEPGDDYGGRRDGDSDDD
jgi:hypothetical protein